ncbi:MAG TPA: hypothetical protein VEY67_07380 [Candidatus Dormibacteraeota bacterium]|nr:hypothetical protein [Candidatus Dormibacteraeota bacterium]
MTGEPEGAGSPVGDGGHQSGPAPTVEASAGASPGERSSFAHASEAEFARILDFYQVGWRYEPHAFPLLWNLDGDVLESFAPDFYLPELDLYVEMTTLRQKLVRKKNRKLRRLRELYPDVRIKLFYARDFRALMLKYGRVALADALSGAEGQLTEQPAAAAEQAGPMSPAATSPAATSPAATRPAGGPVSVARAAELLPDRADTGTGLGALQRRAARAATSRGAIGRTGRKAAPARPIIDEAAAGPAVSARDEGSAG